MILSLFPGIDMLGHAVESELDACVVRGPDVIYGKLSDIRTFHPPAGVFEGVIGGPPCQSFSSLANLVRAKGHEPRFGNLIPEFERCVAEARPRWFLMENVPAAPVPVVEGYAVRDFVLCNSWVDGGDGMGEEQERKRRFSFGVRGKQAPDLRRWIKPAALLLPKAERAVRASSGLGPTAEYERGRTSAVLADSRDTPVAIGGSGKVKRTRVGSVASEPVDNSAEAKGRTRQPAVLADPGSGLGPVSERVPRGRQRAVKADLGTYLGPGGSQKRRIGTVTGGGQERLPGEQLKRGGRRSLAEMCRLQGVPPDLLDDVPWTMQGKRQAIANGVPMPTARAVARAVRCALEEMEAAP